MRPWLGRMTTRRYAGTKLCLLHRIFICPSHLAQLLTIPFLPYRHWNDGKGTLGVVGRL